jgi:hypothetical protein
MFGANYATILPWHEHCLQTERREIPHDWHDLGVPSGAFKTITEPMVCSTQTMHLYYVKISTISKWTELSVEPCHPRLPSGASKTISEAMVCLVQTVHLSCTDTNTIFKQKEEWFLRLTSPRGSTGCVQNDFWAYGMFDVNGAPILHQD